MIAIVQQIKMLTENEVNGEYKAKKQQKALLGFNGLLNIPTDTVAIESLIVRCRSTLKVLGKRQANVNSFGKQEQLYLKRYIYLFPLNLF